MYLRKRGTAVPGGKLPRHSATIFSRIAGTTALVLCDRDNLSPLKEFRDISSGVLSVAKTGLGVDFARRNRKRRPSDPTRPPLRAPLRSTHWPDGRKNLATERRFAADRDNHLARRLRLFYTLCYWIFKTSHFCAAHVSGTW